MAAQSRLDSILSQLNRVKRTSRGYKAECPAHRDENPSLEVWEDGHGGIGVKCYAGCSTDAVLAALGTAPANLKPKKPDRPQRREIAATYDYRDEHGELLYQSVRYYPKGFSQRQPDPKDANGWIWNLDGVRRVLYRLAAVQEAVAAGRTVYIVEGEKDVHALEKWGLTATTNAGGAGKWSSDYSQTLSGADVVVLPDNDTPGYDHAQKVAKSLHEFNATVRIVELPGLPDKGDVSDWITAGGTLEKLEGLTQRTVPWKTDADKDIPSENDGAQRKGRGRKTDIATALVDLAMSSGTELFHAPDQELFASIWIDDHQETWPLKSTGFREWLSRTFYLQTQKAPGGQAMQDALNILCGFARFDYPEISVYTRVAECDGEIYLNLADAQWRVVRITPNGWELTNSAPVKFRRVNGMLPLPAPERGGSIEDLRPFINITDDGWPLVVAWLLAALRPVGPYPVLELRGEQGCAKSTTARVLRALVDPNKAALRVQPENARDLAIAAKNGWVVALDNLSGITGWLSDALCRLATGGGFSTRRLYTDEDEALFDAQRPAILTGIGGSVTRPDLLDRSLLVDLPVIPDTARRAELQFWAEFNEIRPRILGALLDAVAVGLRNSPHTRLESLPRMADFALWVTASEPGLGWNTGDFMAAYTTNRCDANSLALEASPIGELILAFIRSQNNQKWVGTCKELLEALEEFHKQRHSAVISPDGILMRPDGDKPPLPSGWPTKPRAFSTALERIKPNLRQAGLTIHDYRRSSGRMFELSFASESASNGVTQNPNGVTQNPNGVTQNPNGVTQNRIQQASSTHTGAANAANDERAPMYSFAYPSVKNRGEGRSGVKEEECGDFASQSSLAPLDEHGNDFEEGEL